MRSFDRTLKSIRQLKALSTRAAVKFNAEEGDWEIDISIEEDRAFSITHPTS
jgi:hypothetical protein